MAPTHADIIRHFPPNRDPVPGTFEIAVVLSGSGATGAFAAGVVDFLIEALDTWTAAKAAGADVPRHDVKLRVIAGDGSGGISAATAATALRYAHAETAIAWLPDAPGDFGVGGALGPNGKNALFATWVGAPDLPALLEPEPSGTPSALFNGAALDTLAAGIVDFRGAEAAADARTWLDEPLTVLLPLTNLAGVRYGLADALSPSAKRSWGRKHDDLMAFALHDLPGQSVGRRTDRGDRPDAMALRGQNASDKPHWRLLGEAAVAAAGLPLLLPARTVWASAAAYDWRIRLQPTPLADETGGGALTLSAGPAAPAATGRRGAAGRSEDAVRFEAVGSSLAGASAVELARAVLAGDVGRNPRDGQRACRAVIAVDPGLGPPVGTSPDAGDDGVMRVGRGIADALAVRTGLSVTDAALAARTDVYSRFLVAPTREAASGGLRHGAAALAGSGLGGLAGLFAPAYRAHDFFLGRQNAQSFLAWAFAVPEGNPLVGPAYWSEAHKQAVGFDREVTVIEPRGPVRKSLRHYPIIPLLGDCAAPLPTPAWPRNVWWRAEQTDGALTRRLDHLIEAAADGLIGETTGWRRALNRLYLRPLRRQVRDRLLTGLQIEIDEAIARIDALD